jgi:hypothetical protein
MAPSPSRPWASSTSRSISGTPGVAAPAAQLEHLVGHARGEARGQHLGLQAPAGERRAWGGVGVVGVHRPVAALRRVVERRVSELPGRNSARSTDRPSSRSTVIAPRTVNEMGWASIGGSARRIGSPGNRHRATSTGESAAGAGAMSIPPVSAADIAPRIPDASRE